MRPVFSSVEMYHAINAGESGTTTTVAMRVELLLGQDVATRLCECVSEVVTQRCAELDGQREIQRMMNRDARIKAKATVFECAGRGNRQLRIKQAAEQENRIRKEGG
jgi:hypothetical protein